MDYEPVSADGFSGVFSLVREALDQLLSHQRLERHIRAQSLVSSMLAHDLRNPLFVIKSHARLLELRQAPSREGSAPTSGPNTIIRMVDRTDKMLQNLLDIEKAGSGQKFDIAPQEMDLASVVVSVVEDLRAIHGDRFQLVGEKELRGVWDPEGTRRIVENLASNAVKYGDGKAPVLISITGTNFKARIAVTNRGNPIPRPVRGKLFEPFQRGAGAAKGNGWGLGLALVQAIAAAHGGRVVLKSSARHGTTFTAVLPGSMPS